MADYIVGLTGGLACGKTTVSNAFKSHGVDIIDADEISRSITNYDEHAILQIKNFFGPDAVNTDDKGVNRQWLRQRVFSDTSAKEWLESLLHPLINNEIQTKLRESRGPYAVLSSPLLIESAQHENVERVLVVDISEELQLERAQKRDLNSSNETLKSIIKHQTSRPLRLSLADDVISNEGTLDKLYKEVERFHLKYVALSQKK
jgi:dephospho-CoA kinase